MGWSGRWLAAAMMVALAGCQPPKREIGDVWVRLPAVPGRPAAAYFYAKGGGDVVLLGVDSPAAKRGELHEGMAAGMRRIDRLPLRGGEEVRFAPTGRHVMLYGVDPRVKPGGTMPLRFSFAGEAMFDIDAKVVGAADPAPFPAS